MRRIGQVTMRLHRRSLLSLITGIAIASCSRSVQADGTYSIVDTFSEIALAPDGGRCAVQSTEEGVNTVLLASGELSEAFLLSLPSKNHWVRDLSFCEDGKGLLFTAGPPPFDTDVQVFRLDLETLVARPIATGQAYNRVPIVSPDGRKMAFAARGAGSSVLHVYEMDRTLETVERYSDAPFQHIAALAYRPDGALAVGGIPGSDPFDSLRIDEANGFQRVFLLNMDGSPDPSAFAGLGATNLALHGEHDGRLLLRVRHDSPSGVAVLRLALMDRDLGSHQFIDVPDLKGATLTGAAIASGAGLLAVRGANVVGDSTVGSMAVQGLGSIFIRDLATRSARSAIIL